MGINALQLKSASAGVLRGICNGREKKGMSITRKSRLVLLQGGVLLLIAAIFWMKYQASSTLQDIVGYSLFLGLTCVVTYYCLLAMKARVQGGGSSENCIVLARAKSPVWFYLGVSSVCLGFILNGIFFSDLLIRGLSQPSRLWLGAAFGAFAFGLLYAWLGAYQLRICTPVFEYWSLFGGYRSLLQDQIQKAQFTSGWFPYWDRYRPSIRLEILPAIRLDYRPIIVNLKVFRREDVNRVCDWLGTKLDDPDTVIGGRAVSSEPEKSDKGQNIG